MTIRSGTPGGTPVDVTPGVEDILPNRAALLALPNPNKGQMYYLTDERRVVVCTDETPGAVVWKPVDPTGSQIPNFDPATNYLPGEIVLVQNSGGTYDIWLAGSAIAANPNIPGTPGADVNWTNVGVLQSAVDALVSGLTHSAAVQNIVKTPPASPQPDETWIVDATGTTGAFVGQENKLASWVSGAWQFTDPSNGETHLVEVPQETHSWNGTAWVKVGAIFPTFAYYDSNGDPTTAYPTASADFLIDTFGDWLVAYNNGGAWFDIADSDRGTVSYITDTDPAAPFTAANNYGFGLTANVEPDPAVLTPAANDFWINRTTHTIGIFTGIAPAPAPPTGVDPAPPPPENSFITIPDTLNPNTDPLQYGTGRTDGDKGITKEAVWEWTDDQTRIPTISSVAAAFRAGQAPPGVDAGDVAAGAPAPTQRQDGTPLQPDDYYVNGVRIWEWQPVGAVPAHWLDTGFDIVPPVATTAPAWVKLFDFDSGIAVVPMRDGDRDPNADKPMYGQNRKPGDIAISQRAVYEWVTDELRAMTLLRGQLPPPLPAWIAVTALDWVAISVTEPPRVPPTALWLSGHLTITPTGVYIWETSPQQLAGDLVPNAVSTEPSVANQAALPTPAPTAGKVRVTLDTMHAWIATPGGWNDTGIVIPAGGGWIKDITFAGGGGGEHLFNGPKDLPTGDPNDLPALATGRTQGEHLVTDKAVWFWNTDQGVAGFYAGAGATQMGNGGTGVTPLTTDLNTMATPADGDSIVAQDTNKVHIWDAGAGPAGNWVVGPIIPIGPHWIKEFDLTGNQQVHINNAIGGAPSTAVTDKTGDLFYNPTDRKVWVFDGTNWIELETTAVYTSNTPGFTPSSTNAVPPIAHNIGTMFVNDADHEAWVWGIPDMLGGGAPTWLRLTPLKNVVIPHNVTGRTPFTHPPVRIDREPVIEGDMCVNTVDGMVWVFHIARSGAANWMPIVDPPMVTVATVAGQNPGSNPPGATASRGDVYVNTSDGSNWIYGPTGTWVPATPSTGNVYVSDTSKEVPGTPASGETQYTFPAGTTLAEGDRFVNRIDHTDYVYGPDPTGAPGTLIWIALPADSATTVTTTPDEVPGTPGAGEVQYAFPRPPRIGDTFYNTADQRLWLRAANPAGAGDIWQPVTASTPPIFGGVIGRPPTVLADHRWQWSDFAATNAVLDGMATVEIQEAGTGVRTSVVEVGKAYDVVINWGAAGPDAQMEIDLASLPVGSTEFNITDGMTYTTPVLVAGDLPFTVGFYRSQYGTEDARVRVTARGLVNDFNSLVNLTIDVDGITDKSFLRIDHLPADGKVPPDVATIGGQDAAIGDLVLVHRTGAAGAMTLELVRHDPPAGLALPDLTGTIPGEVLTVAPGPAIEWRAAARSSAVLVGVIAAANTEQHEYTWADITGGVSGFPVGGYFIIEHVPSDGKVPGNVGGIGNRDISAGDWVVVIDSDSDGGADNFHLVRHDRPPQSVAVLPAGSPSGPAFDGQLGWFVDNPKEIYVGANGRWAKVGLFSDRNLGLVSKAMSTWSTSSGDWVKVPNTHVGITKHFDEHNSYLICEGRISGYGSSSAIAQFTFDISLGGVPPGAGTLQDTEYYFNQADIHQTIGILGGLYNMPAGQYGIDLYVRTIAGFAKFDANDWVSYTVKEVPR